MVPSSSRLVRLSNVSAVFLNVFFFTGGSETVQDATVTRPIRLLRRHNYDTSYLGETRQILTAHSEERRRQNRKRTPPWTDESISFVVLKRRFGDCSIRQQMFLFHLVTSKSYTNICYTSNLWTSVYKF